MCSNKLDLAHFDIREPFINNVNVKPFKYLFNVLKADRCMGGGDL